MKVLFMGTPDFAVGSLSALVDAGYDLAAVVTQPDKPAGRGHKIKFPAVKEYAVEHNIPVYQPETLKGEAFLKELQLLDPEMIIVTAYGKILPSYLLDYPKYGCINVHASLLPHLRGAAPIQWSVINGDTKTGITTMLMDAGLDTGDMLLKEEIPIDPHDTVGEVFDKLYQISGPLLVRTIEGILDGSVRPQKQPDEGSSYAPMLNRENTKIDWNQDAERVYNLVRGLSPYPLAHTTYDGRRVKIISAGYETGGSGVPGKIGEYTKGKGLPVFCGSGRLFIRELQMEGKKRMKIDDFLRGNHLDDTVLFQ